MSFWKTFGKINLGILKGVGKAAGNVVGNYVGVQGLGNAFDKNKSNATGGAPVSALDGTQAVSNTSPSIGQSLTGLFGAATDFLSGRAHAQVDVNTGVGGRANDPTNSSGLPSWALPAAIGGGLLLLLTSGGGRRR
ncbi:hypothetical protein [Mucilaginibacter flavus]|uniref:hypothetical protein n=1 Tax=Mucilaginibacter flavus TaxID=931504 RepID=UPI0025B296CB|nr:hypothetical protein [Mucilaginibacter flavus]MDN3584736.1 hypothetical protein [Mucilaginibacter flavus]